MKLITWYHIVTIGIGLSIIGGVFASEMLESTMNEDIPKIFVFFTLSVIAISLGFALINSGYNVKKSLDQTSMEE